MITSTKRPLFACDDCDGRGRSKNVSFDELGKLTEIVPCEACEAAGQLSECAVCREVISAHHLRCETHRRLEAESGTP